MNSNACRSLERFAEHRLLVCIRDAKSPVVATSCDSFRGEWHRRDAEGSSRLRREAVSSSTTSSFSHDGSLPDGRGLRLAMGRLGSRAGHKNGFGGLGNILSDSDGNSVVPAAGRGGRGVDRRTSHGGSRTGLASASSSTVGINVNLKVITHLLLDGLGVDVLLRDPILNTLLLGHGSARSLLNNLDINGAGVGLVARDCVHGESMRVLFASHEGASPGEDTVLGGLNVHLLSVQVGPVPVPVQSVDGASLQVRGQLDIALAEELSVVVGSIIRQFLGTTVADRTGVGLEALAVIIVSSSEKPATLVTTSSVTAPAEVNVEELLLSLWLRSAVDEDGSSVLWLEWLVLRKGSMAILSMQQGNMVSRRCLEHGKFGVSLKFILVDHFLATVESLARWWEEMLRNRVTPSRFGTSHPSTSITRFTNHGAI